jgi:hypothetical protein
MKNQRPLEAALIVTIRPTDIESIFKGLSSPEQNYWMLKLHEEFMLLFCLSRATISELQSCVLRKLGGAKTESRSSRLTLEKRFKAAPYANHNLLLLTSI